MKKICEICNNEFESNSSTRIYCYNCSGDSTRGINETRKHQKTILRRSMKLQAIKLLGGKCSICGYNKCVDALEFHHKDPTIKEFKLGSENTVFCEMTPKDKKYCIYFDEISEKILKNVPEQNKKYVKKQLAQLDKNFMDYLYYWNEKYYRNGFADVIELFYS